MKIIQSLWTKPVFNKTRDDDDIWSREVGGWHSIEFFLTSWALSCICLRRKYRNVEIFTDSLGEKILRDLLDLPYTGWTIALNDLDNYSNSLWALGKVYTYQLQTTPFIHIDGDVFLWRKLPSRLLDKPLVAQNKESNYVYYYEVLSNLSNRFTYVPDVLGNKICSSDSQLISVDAGILGGVDLEFFRNYTGEAFKFVNNNVELSRSGKVGNFNIIYEQLLFQYLAEKDGVPIEYLFKTEPQNMDFLIDLRSVPFKTTYSHIFGSYKKNVDTCRRLRRKLMEESPRHYFLIQHILKNDMVEKLVNELI